MVVFSTHRDETPSIAPPETGVSASDLIRVCTTVLGYEWMPRCRYMVALLVYFFLVQSSHFSDRLVDVEIKSSICVALFRGALVLYHRVLVLDNMIII